MIKYGKLLPHASDSNCRRYGRYALHTMLSRYVQLPQQMEWRQIGIVFDHEFLEWYQTKLFALCGVLILLFYDISSKTTFNYRVGIE